MQAIDEYEKTHNIPTNWINYAIRYAAPNGHWQKLERGEIKLDAAFYKGFSETFQNIKAWESYLDWSQSNTKLKDAAKLTQLGDHVSLKAETAESNPTPDDKGATPSTSKSDSVAAGRPSLSKLAKDTTIGDPVSLESEAVAETSSKESRSTSAPSVKDLSPSPSGNGPPPIGGEDLFWKMMSISRQPDPYIFPALQELFNLRPRPIIAALSNTVIFPKDHPWRKTERPESSKAGADRRDVQSLLLNPQSFWDVYVSSAEVGMRKPSKEIFELTLRQLNEYAKKEKLGEVSAEGVVFLDDIGENLKTAQSLGMKTIKVQMGKTWRAVKQLEEDLGGAKLMDEKTRRSKL